MRSPIRRNESSFIRLSFAVSTNLLRYSVGKLSRTFFGHRLSIRNNEVLPRFLLSAPLANALQTCKVPLWPQALPSPRRRALPRAQAPPLRVRGAQCAVQRSSGTRYASGFSITLVASAVATCNLVDTQHCCERSTGGKLSYCLCDRLAGGGGDALRHAWLWKGAR